MRRKKKQRNHYSSIPKISNYNIFSEVESHFWQYSLFDSSHIGIGQADKRQAGDTTMN